MRNLSLAAQAVFNDTGIEPVILVRIHWAGGNGITYSERQFANFGFTGKLISVGQIDDTVNIDANSNSAQVSIILDDTDGALKQIFNNSDIHKVKAQLLQWSTDLAPSDAFVIFTGEIASPIEWKESDRTLNFDIVTKIEDKQVGFSVEDGLFPDFPTKLIGKAWPIVFGTVGGVPALQIIETPTAIIGEPFAVMDERVWKKELDDLNAQIQLARHNAQLAFQNGVAEAFVASQYKGATSSGGLSLGGIINDDPQTALSHDLAADNYFAQSAAYTDDANNIDKQIQLKQQLQKKQEQFGNKTTIKFITINWPHNLATQFKVGSSIIKGIYSGNQTFTITGRVFPEDFNHRPRITSIQAGQTPGLVKTSDIYGNPPQQVEFGQKFIWVDAGTEVRAINLPLSYVVSVNPVNIHAVWGYRRGVRVIVPSTYYRIDPPGNFQTITFAQPLSARTFFNGVNEISEGWDGDNIEIDCTSTVGPNTIDIMIWAITLYTKFSIDITSFMQVRAYLDAYPMNFVLLEKINIIEFLQQLAYQARCSIWLSDGVFFIRYLPVIPTAIDTITNDDIVVNSLSITCDDTENLVTSYVASWKANTWQQEDFKIIYEYNIAKYGFKQETYNYYAYNRQNFVQKSAEFWMIRKSNTFKLLRFKTAIHKIKIESFDAINIDLDVGLVSNGPITGTVLKATYNVHDKTIDMEVWLPIRFGEMDRFAFAEPYLISLVYPLVNDPNLKTDNPFELAGILPQTQYLIDQHSPFQHFTGENFGPPVNGRYFPMGDQFGPGPDSPNQYGPYISGGLDLKTVDLTTGFDSGGFKTDDLIESNSYLQYKVAPLTTPTVNNATNASFPGLVVSTKDQPTQIYNVNVFFNGLAGTPTSMAVKQFSINANDEVLPGTPVEVHRLVYKNENGQTVFELWMQAPVWQPTLPETEDSGTGGGGGGTGGGGGGGGGGGNDGGGGGGDDDTGDVTDEGFPDEGE